ncbi:MAG: sec-C motif containing protein [Marmoricola sp.]|nr:sec-C motif containing protein [Marmoricola sp.]
MAAVPPGPLALPGSGACPCGSGSAYDVCCGPLHRGERQAGTPEELMRSRFTAYALGDTAHAWHPRTRPAEVSHDPTTRWTRLEVLEADGDVVEFRAHHVSGGVAGVLHERSLFARRAGRWFYLEAV